jgi:hypothetical protein
MRHPAPSRKRLRCFANRSKHPSTHPEPCLSLRKRLETAPSPEIAPINAPQKSPPWLNWVKA